MPFRETQKELSNASHIRRFQDKRLIFALQARPLCHGFEDAMRSTHALEPIHSGNDLNRNARIANDVGSKDRMAEKQQTIKAPPVLFDQTQQIINSLEKELDGTFLSYWVSENSRLTGQDVPALYELLGSTDQAKTLYVFMRSDGGSGIAALRMVHLLRQRASRIVALVPLDCASAATMLALGADEIHMGPVAYLSAIDTSITHFLSPVDKDNDLVSVSQNELERVHKLWEEHATERDGSPYSKLYDHIHPLVFGAVDRANSLSIQLTTEILSYHMEDLDKAKLVATHLNAAYPSHDFPITLKEASQLGLQVTPLKATWNEALLSLNKLYAEMAQLAYTDYDERNYHDNEILKVLEISGSQIFYQKDKDWHYRAEERKWIPMNDDSSWRRIDRRSGGVEESRFFLG